MAVYPAGLIGFVAFLMLFSKKTRHIGIAIMVVELILVVAGVIAFGPLLFQ